eukprot:1302679-Amphidinium_carterae.1
MIRNHRRVSLGAQTSKPPSVEQPAIASSKLDCQTQVDHIDSRPCATLGVKLLLSPWWAEAKVVQGETGAPCHAFHHTTSETAFLSAMSVWFKATCQIAVDGCQCALCYSTRMDHGIRRVVWLRSRCVSRAPGGTIK